MALRRPASLGRRPRRQRPSSWHAEQTPINMPRRLDLELIMYEPRARIQEMEQTHGLQQLLYTTCLEDISIKKKSCCAGPTVCPSLHVPWGHYCHCGVPVETAGCCVASTSGAWYYGYPPWLPLRWNSGRRGWWRYGISSPGSWRLGG